MHLVNFETGSNRHPLAHVLGPRGRCRHSGPRVSGGLRLLPPRQLFRRRADAVPAGRRQALPLLPGISGYLDYRGVWNDVAEFFRFDLDAVLQSGASIEGGGGKSVGT